VLFEISTFELPPGFCQGFCLPSRSPWLKPGKGRAASGGCLKRARLKLSLILWKTRALINSALNRLYYKNYRDDRDYPVFISRNNSGDLANFVFV
jgi:hypothetical protein